MSEFPASSSENATIPYKSEEPGSDNEESISESAPITQQPRLFDATSKEPAMITQQVQKFEAITKGSSSENSIKYQESGSGNEVSIPEPAPITEQPRVYDATSEEPALITKQLQRFEATSKGSSSENSITYQESGSGNEVSIPEPAPITEQPRLYDATSEEPALITQQLRRFEATSKGSSSENPITYQESGSGNEVSIPEPAPITQQPRLFDATSEEPALITQQLRRFEATSKASSSKHASTTQEFTRIEAGGASYSVYNRNFGNFFNDNFPGLTVLQSGSTLYLKQESGCYSNGKTEFTVLNEYQQPILNASENEGGGIKSYLCGRCRTFECDLFDEGNRNVLHISRPFKCGIQEAFVTAPPNRRVGTVTETASFSYELIIKNIYGRELFRINGGSICCSDKTWKILSPAGIDVGEIIVLEKERLRFPTAYTYQESCNFFGIYLPSNTTLVSTILLLAATFIICVTYVYENEEHRRRRYSLEHRWRFTHQDSDEYRTNMDKRYQNLVPHSGF